MFKNIFFLFHFPLYLCNHYRRVRASCWSAWGTSCTRGATSWGTSSRGTVSCGWGPWTGPSSSRAGRSAQIIQKKLNDTPCKRFNSVTKTRRFAHLCILFIYGSSSSHSSATEYLLGIIMRYIVILWYYTSYLHKFTLKCSFMYISTNVQDMANTVIRYLYLLFSIF